MDITEKIQYLNFDLLSAYPQVKHAVLERKGGVSKAPFDSLNVSFYVGDDPLCVEENRRRIQSFFSIPKYIIPALDHGDQVALVETCSMPPNADAVITREKNLALMMTHADCQCIFLFDPITETIGLIHVGWRGNVNQIIRKTINKMKEAFSTNPEHILVCVSPSLGPTKAEFVNYSSEFPSSFAAHKVGDSHFNLWEITRSQLLESGIILKNIEFAGVCTHENAAKYFSYRRDKFTGRNASFVMLSNE